MKTLKKFDKQTVVYAASVGLLFLFFVFFITCTQIGFDVKKRCEIAQNKYEGGCVDALMGWVADESSPYGKNDAIWALGQIGDKKALPFLEKYVNGETVPEREKWNERISQYELRKAVKLLKSGMNVSALIWR